MARMYLKDVRKGSPTGYDPKIDELHGWNAEMAKIPFLKTIDLDDCEGWTNEIPYTYVAEDDRYIPHDDALEVQAAEADLVLGRTQVADSPEEAERLAIEAAERKRSGPTEEVEEVEETDSDREAREYLESLEAPKPAMPKPAKKGK